MKVLTSRIQASSAKPPQTDSLAAPAFISTLYQQLEDKPAPSKEQTQEPSPAITTASSTLNHQLIHLKKSKSATPNVKQRKQR